MPVKSKKQYRYVRAMRSKYKTKVDAPEDMKWTFAKELTDVDYDKLPEDKQMKPYKRLFNEGRNTWTITVDDIGNEILTYEGVDVYEVYKYRNDLYLSIWATDERGNLNEIVAEEPLRKHQRELRKMGIPDPPRNLIGVLRDIEG